MRTGCHTPKGCSSISWLTKSGRIDKEPHCSARGPATCKLIKGLGSFGETLLQRSLKELVQLVNAHKRKQSSLIVQQFQFHSRGQMETEAIAQYVAILKTTIDKLQCCRCFGRHAMGSTCLWAAGCSARGGYCQRKTLPSNVPLTYARPMKNP